MSEQYNADKLLLIILDGWGYSKKYHGNAIKQAYTPTLDLLWHNYPSTLLNASENHVGLPKKQMGNSEVGHATIGAGRIINQALVRISKSIESGSFFSHSKIHEGYELAQQKKGSMHIIGLCSDGGVHSHIQHLIALLKISKSYTSVKVCIHAITDGRDTEPQSATGFMSFLLQEIQDAPNIQVCTISGRYYSMDRDCRWPRTMKAYDCLISNNRCQENHPMKLLKNCYEKGMYDEFITPTRIAKGDIKANDSVICFNFRPDRMRQLTQALCSSSFEGFTRSRIENLHVTTFTAYDNSLNVPTVFTKMTNKNFLGQVIAEKGLKQFRLAETEKYAHVTYFFNGGQEAPFPGEYRELIPSPRVETYDLTPEMAASHITQQLTKAIKEDKYQFIVVNYANPDMIGHTGQMKETKISVEIVDNSISELLRGIYSDKKTAVMITADHGNADIMLDHDNEPCKSHTSNLVPLIIIEPGYELKEIQRKRSIKLKTGGSLADIAPTILDILKIQQPEEMSGQSLIENK